MICQLPALNFHLANTVELQWLEHLLNYENILKERFQLRGTNFFLYTPTEKGNKNRKWQNKYPFKCVLKPIYIYIYIYGKGK